MTLKEVMERTRSMSICEGGLSLMIEKLVSEIEKMQSDIRSMSDSIDFLQGELSE